MNAKKLVAIFSVMALVAGALAQGGGRGGFGGQRGGFGGGPLQLLMRDDVKDELKLTSDQTTKVTDLQAKQRENMRDAMQNSGIQFGPDMSDADRKKIADVMAKLNADVQKEVDGILTTEQGKRLKELTVQRAGVGIANNPAFQAELGITDDQKTKLGDLQKKQQAAMMSLFQNQDMSREDRQAAMEKNNKIMTDEIGKILTDDQKKKITEMGGAPFTFKDQPRGGGR